jgi:hypothetical protein
MWSTPKFSGARQNPAGCALGRACRAESSRLVHDGGVDVDRALTDARAALAAAAQRLAGEGAAPEQFALTVPAHRALGLIPRRESFKRTGEGFLFGVLLVTTAGDVFATGSVVRASRQVLPGHQSESAQARREVRHRLLDARLPEGSTVVIDARALPLDDAAALAAERGPLVLRTGGEIEGVFVRWMPSAPDSALRPLSSYLAERLELALTTLAAARTKS